MTVRVSIQNNMNRCTVDADSSNTLREVVDMAEGNGVVFANEIMQLDGTALVAGDINKTLEALGYTGEPGHNRAFLIGAAQKNNANN